MEHLRCVVERITYQNSDNGYSVIKCRAKGYQDLVTVVGSMPDVHVGSVLYLGGSWKIDARYGRQFSMETFERHLRRRFLRLSTGSKNIWGAAWSRGSALPSQGGSSGSLELIH